MSRLSRCPGSPKWKARTGKGKERISQSREKEGADTDVFRVAEAGLSNEGESLASEL